MFKRTILTMLAALSMLLFAAVVADWVRSYWVVEAVGYRGIGSSRRAKRRIIILSKQVLVTAVPSSRFGSRFRARPPGASVRPNLSPSVMSGIPMSGSKWTYSRFAAGSRWTLWGKKRAKKRDSSELI
jgi:hypothetical protein